MIAALRTMAAANTLPDNIHLYTGGNEYHSFVVMGALKQVDALIARDKLDLKQYRSNSTNAALVDGKYYGLPLGINPNAMFYNVDALKKASIPLPPRKWDDKSWTWDRFLDIAQRLTKDGGTPTQSQWGWLEWGDWSDQIALVAAGGKWFDSPIKATKCVCDTPEGARGLQFVQDLIYRYRVHPTPADKAAFGGVDKAFATGQVALTNGDWKMATTLVEPIKDFQWAAAPYPSGPQASRSRRSSTTPPAPPPPPSTRTRPGSSSAGSPGTRKVCNCTPRAPTWPPSSTSTPRRTTRSRTTSPTPR
jgi:multiple sugar transport system substrate-binding protein